MQKGTLRADGLIWNGFEHVTRERFEQMEGTDNFVLHETVEGEKTLIPADPPAAVRVPMSSLVQRPSLQPFETTALFHEILRRIEGGDYALREGLQDTPKRVVKAFRHWFSGYEQDPAALLKVFEDGAENYDQMVTVKDIPIYSKCEHHMADIFGTATIAYIPNGKIVGLSKLSRLADCFARRLQVQERLTAQIADALEKHLEPKGVGVLIKARHMCMESRGVCQQGHYTITTALRGVILNEASTRSEFMALAR